MHNATFLGTFTGRNYRHPEPAVTLPQAILAALALALFVVGGLLCMYGLAAQLPA